MAKGGLLPVPLDALLSREFSPRKFILNELLQQSGLAMVYAWRGLGKTWFALELGYAAATGGASSNGLLIAHIASCTSAAKWLQRI